MYLTTLVPLLGHTGFEQTRDALPALLTLTIQQKAQTYSVNIGGNRPESILNLVPTLEALSFC